MTNIVYEHWIDEKCIYVGMGSKDRAYSLYRNNTLYEKITKDRKEEIEVKIVKTFLNRIEAIQYEEGLIRFHLIESDCLTNISIGHKVYHTEPTKKKISDNHIGEKNSMWNKSLFDFMSVEEIKDWRKNQKENTPKGKSHFESKPIIASKDETTLKFDTIKDCSDYFKNDFSRMSLSKQLRGINIPKVEKSGWKFEYEKVEE